MDRFKCTLMIAISSIVLTIAVIPCSAADADMKISAVQSVTPPGSTQLVFTSTAEQIDHTASLAAGDSLRDVAATLTRAPKALFSIENGTVNIAVPAISPELQANAKGFTGMTVTLQLISGTF